MRNEIKIPVNKDFSFIFNNWKDFQNKISRPYQDRFINSIYYDDENFTTAQDNLSGISNRRKYRIRWYGSELKNFLYEIKIKRNNLGKKISLKTNQDKINLENLFSFNNRFLNKKENKFFLEYLDSFNLKPQLKVSYLRSYFLYEGKIRITFDQKINYSLVNKLHKVENKINDFMSVIEIKFMPENYDIVLNLLKDSNFIPKRFSKYLRGLYLSGIANYI
tara:strand:+ start:65 stop:724 length:660 start_codon:yes stop_codon:yes gene_type:complete